MKSKQIEQTRSLELRSRSFEHSIPHLSIPAEHNRIQLERNGTSDIPQRGSRPAWWMTWKSMMSLTRPPMQSMMIFENDDGDYVCRWPSKRGKYAFFAVNLTMIAKGIRPAWGCYIRWLDFDEVIALDDTYTSAVTSIQKWRKSVNVLQHYSSPLANLLHISCALFVLQRQVCLPIATLSV